MTRKPLKIGVSPRFLHSAPREMGFRGKTLQYLEQTVAHWLMTAGALVFMVPSIAGNGLLRRGNIRVADYVEELDGLVLQGGADVSPLTYGETPLKPAWTGDRVRDLYEIDLLQEFVSRGKPVLGICRGLQLINVAFGGTLYQDVSSQHAGGGEHLDPDAYDEHYHAISILPGSGLAGLYPGISEARVNSIHHQAAKVIGEDLVVEALSAPDQVIEAVRWRGSSYVLGVQWHPEFHHPDNPDLLDGDPLLQEFLGHAEQARGPRSLKPAAEGTAASV
jgi:gamma-glutamyl-gamma-aminobutyrate hydrolase PuuD